MTAAENFVGNVAAIPSTAATVASGANQVFWGLSGAVQMGLRAELQRQLRQEAEAAARQLDYHFTQGPVYPSP